jgi:hypothetical protein
MTNEQISNYQSIECANLQDVDGVSAFTPHIGPIHRSGVPSAVQNIHDHHSVQDFSGNNLDSFIDHSYL